MVKTLESGSSKEQRTDDIDVISHLPDAIILQILSFLPMNYVVATSILSKRWQSLWKLVLRLDFDESYFQEPRIFVQFVNRVLLLHRSPVIEALRLSNESCEPSDVGTWIRVAIDRCVQELDICYSSDFDPIRLPHCLFTSNTLVVLKLCDVILLNVPSSPHLPCLKTLHLLCLHYIDDGSVHRFLSSCPVLEDLLVERFLNDNVITFNISVPTLQSLSITFREADPDNGEETGFFINVPSLKYLKIADHLSCYYLIENLSEVVEANINARYDHAAKLLWHLGKVEHLSLSSTMSGYPYHISRTFHFLVHLEIFVAYVADWKLVLHLLQDSPKLQVLELKKKHTFTRRVSEPGWEDPSHVPKCLSYHLETFNFWDFEGLESELKLVKYILQKSQRLKTATISPKSTNMEENSQILKDLSTFPRGSSTCELGFK